jgi:membrane associated rhomboid family serine protease
MITEERRKFYKSLIVPGIVIILMWVVRLIEYISGGEFYRLGVYPRYPESLSGILTSPMIHGDWNHLISNSLPLFVSLLSIFYFYKNAALKVFLFIYIFTGTLVWAAGREVWHIGASGIVYGFIAFLFFSGIFRRDNRSIAVALVVTFLYGGMVWGILPGWKGISWESHLFGAITGIAAAFIFRRSDPQKKYEWEDEPEDDESEVPFDRNKL